jgi:MFS family permease
MLCGSNGKILLEGIGMQYSGWRIAILSGMGLILSYPSLLMMTFGVMVPYWRDAHGWTAGEVSLALTASTLAAIFAGPCAGMLIDRHGPRKIIVGSLAAMSLCLALGAMLLSDLWQLYLFFFVVTIAGSGAAPIGYSRLLMNWFGKRQGQALGIALAGVGIGAIVAPLLAQYILSAGHSWMTVYATFGAINLLTILPLLLLFLRERPNASDQLALSEINSSAGAATTDVAGRQLPSLLKRREFWLLVAFFLLTGFALTGSIAHLVPILREHGISGDMAAVAMSAMGITLIVGRLFSGWLMDRIFAPYVAAIFMAAPMVGLCLLWASPALPAAFGASLLFGAGTGAEMALLAFLIRKYFALANFGYVYGIIFAAFNIGSGIGAPVAGYMADANSGYSSVLLLNAGMLLLSILIAFGLPPYIRPNSEASR